MYGKERLLLIVLLMLAFGTFISAIASSLWLMVLGRLIQGAGGGIFPLAFSIIRDEFPNERVPGAIGLVSSLLGIGGGAGVVFAGLITENLSYHWLFWFPIAIVVVGQMAGLLERRIGSRWSLIAGAAFALASYALLGFDRSQELQIYVA